MPATELRLLDEDRQFLLAHYPFYHALDTGERIPSTEAQRQFVAVCRGAAPSTPHERAFTRLREFLRVTGLSEQDMVSSGFRLSAPSARADVQEVASPGEALFTESALGNLTPRKRAILKLRTGCLPLAEVELAKVLPDKRTEALAVRPRTLQEVADLFGLSRERIRQIESRARKQLGRTHLG